MNTLLRTGSNVSPDKTAKTAPHLQDGAEETLIVDRRGSLRPAEMVELKLRALLRGKMPVSQIQTVHSLRSRN